MVMIVGDFVLGERRRLVSSPNRMKRRGFVLPNVNYERSLAFGAILAGVQENELECKTGAAALQY